MKTLNVLIILTLIFILASCNGSKLTSDSSSKSRTKQNTDKNAWESDWVEEEEEVADVPPPPQYFGVKFVKSEMLKPLLEQAKAEGKLVFVDFYASWCGPCKVMDKSVFSEKRMGDFMSENFISYKVNADESHLSALYEVKSLPTLLFLDTEGEVIVRKDGALGFNAFKAMGEKALRMMNTSASGGRE